MSQSEIDRLVADLKSDSALRAEAEKTEAGRVGVNGARAMPMAAFVSFAARQGYNFTADEVMERVRAAKPGVESKHLTDAQLDGIAGGGDQLDVVFSGSTWRDQLDVVLSGSTWGGSDAEALFVSFDEDNNNTALGAGNEGQHVYFAYIPNQAATDAFRKPGSVVPGDEDYRALEEALRLASTKRSD